ncbi:MAG: hypothetical protein OEZ08_11325 [Betaproteobacteria bacterium]|nr:hypothetical protein [Betaproteobacteria bacterium]
MSNLTTHQLAELLLGVARAQQAIIDAIEDSKAGFKSTHFRPMLETASRIRSNRAETLADFPPRLLLHMMGRNAPAADMVASELEVLLARAEAGAMSPPGADPGGAGASETTKPGA